MTPRRSSIVTTSPSRIAASLASRSPGSTATVDAQRAEMAGQDGGVCVEVDGALVGPRRHPEPAADVDLGDRRGRLARARSTASMAAEQRALERRQAVGQPARPGVEMDRVDARPWRRAAASASSNRSSPIPNFVGRLPLYSRWSL